MTLWHRIFPQVARRRTHRKLLRYGAILLSVAVSAPFAAAHEPPGNASQSRPGSGWKAAEKPPPPGAHQRRGPGGPRGPAAPRELRELFEPSPEDFGPAEPEELEELRRFVRAQLPELDRTLQRLESRGPRAYEKGLRRLLPHLRHLRRLHAQEPRLAELVSRHAENLFQIERLRRAWPQADQSAKTELENELRTRVRDNLRVEIQTLRLWADRLVQEREQRMQARLQALTATEADLSAEPPRVRELVRALSTAEDEAERQRLCDQLKQVLNEELDRRTTALRTRAAQIESELETEVDRRFERLLRASPPLGPPP